MTTERTNRLGVPGVAGPGEDERVAGASSGLDRWLAATVARRLGSAPIGISLWDGSAFGSDDRDAVRIRLADRGALWGLALNPEMNFGDFYSAGRLMVDGDLVRLIDLAYGSLARPGRRWNLASLIAHLASRAPSLSRAKRNIHHHYDIGNDFYALWLDREGLQYTCAYYPSAEATLEQAQVAKMDHVCRKLCLKADERVVETGCGWGGFAIFMAKRYGARVRAFNISKEQIAYATEWAAREGVDDKVEFVLDDYRNATGRCDVFVSIGMLEHAGRRNYPTLGRLIDRCLEPNGRGLIHSIGRDRKARLNPWIARRIFPGSYPPTLREMMDIFEPNGLSVLDVENLRPHYARTLRHWLERFEQNAARVREMYDASFERAWRLYLSGSVAAFDHGTLQLFQVLFARSGKNPLPETRAHQYSRTGY